MAADLHQGKAATAVGAKKVGKNRSFNYKIMALVVGSAVYVGLAVYFVVTSNASVEKTGRFYVRAFAATIYAVLCVALMKSSDFRAKVDEWLGASFTLFGIQLSLRKGVGANIVNTAMVKLSH